MKNINKIIYLLSKNELKSSIILLLMILTMAFLDTLGVASILPFITVLANPGIIETNAALSYMYHLTGSVGVTNVNQFLLILGFMVFLLLIISISFRSATAYLQIHFTLMREYSIGKRFIEAYLHQPYVWFLNRNSSDLSKTILSEVNQVIYQTIVPMMTIIAHGSVAIAIVTLLFIVDPSLALGVGGVLILCYAILYLFIKNFLSRIGSERLQANEMRFKIVNEAFGASKEVKVSGLEQVYINRFHQPAKIYASSQARAQVSSQLPHFMIEGIAFGGMLLLVLVLMLRNGNFSSTIPILALYAFAGYRLMPAMRQIWDSITLLRFSGPALDALYNDLSTLERGEKTHEIISSIKLKNSIQLNNIFFKYPETKLSALNGINLRIPSNSKIGIVGTTGSGKTTLIDIILGLLDPLKGSMKVDDILISKNNKRHWQKSIGYVPQKIYLSDSSIAENIAFGINVESIDYKLIHQAAKIANLHEFVTNELPDGYQTIIGERGVRLSGGQCQRVGIARALYHKPKVLVLDEATSALDNITEKIVMEAMNNLGSNVTIILVAHRLSTVRNCDLIYHLESGKVIGQGTYEILNRKNSIFQKMSSSN